MKKPVKTKKKVTKKKVTPKVEPKVEEVKAPQFAGFHEDGKWHGITRYRCNSCKHETLNLDNMVEHVVENHTPKSRRERMAAGEIMVDKQAAPLRMMVEPPMKKGE